MHDPVFLELIFGVGFGLGRGVLAYQCKVRRSGDVTSF